MQNVASVLFSMRLRGIRVWTDQGELHYEAPRGALAPADVQELRTLKGEIVAFLQRSRCTASPEEPLVSRPTSDQAPLAIIQHGFWNFICANAGRSIRPPVVICRLTGRLDIAALERALTELIRHHEILRTNIAADRGVPLQRIREPYEIRLERIRMAGASAAERQENASRMIKQLAEETIDPAVDPLFKAGLLALDADDHVFFVLMDHILFDGSSTTILHRDLITLFVQAAHGRSLSLPAMPIQFADYALWQQRTRASRIDVHDAFWSARLAGARHLRVFADAAARANPSKLVRHPLVFDRKLTGALRGFCMARRTTLMMTLLTVFVALLSRWCERTDLVVSVPTVARRQPQVANTIGPFGSLLFLRVSVDAQDSFVTLLERLVEEYSIAYEHDDSGKLAVTMPQAEFVSNPSLNFLPQYYEACTVPSWSAASRGSDTLREAPFQLCHELDGIDYGSWEPALFVGEGRDEVAGFLTYRTELATVSSVERFAKYLLQFAWALANEPAARLPLVDADHRR